MFDRRRTSLTVLILLTAAAAGGCAAPRATASGAAPATTASRVSPVASRPAAVKPAVSDVPRTIPASAFLRMPADMLVGRPRSASTLPRLCGNELRPGDGVVASAARLWNYKRPEDLPDTIYAVLYETIRSYEGDGADAFLDRVRSDLARCPSYRDGGATVKVRVTALSGAGDEAITIDLVRPRLDPQGNPEKGTQSNRIVVVRFGPVIVLLIDTAYERSSSVPDLVGVFVREATRAVRTWRG